MNTLPLLRNNDPGFEGLADNTYFWNITAGLAIPAAIVHCRFS